MRSLGPNVLHQILLEQVQSEGSLAEAERNLLLLHAVLIARLSNRGVTAPNEKQVYQELRRMMEE